MAAWPLVDDASSHASGPHAVSPSALATMKALHEVGPLCETSEDDHPPPKVRTRSARVACMGPRRAPPAAPPTTSYSSPWRKAPPPPRRARGRPCPPSHRCPPQSGRPASEGWTPVGAVGRPWPAVASSGPDARTMVRGEYRYGCICICSKYCCTRLRNCRNCAYRETYSGKYA